MKKQTVFWISGTALLLGIIAYFVNDVKKQAKIQANPSDYPDYNTAMDSTSGGTNLVIITTFPLKKGSRGGKVKKLQLFLNTKYNPKLSVDGEFGTATEAAVKNMQTLPSSSAISDFFASNPFVSGQVSEAFYNKFI